MTNKKHFTFSDNDAEYEIQLKPKRRICLWWLLLLLLPLLLLIPFEKEIYIEVVNSENQPIKEAAVSFEYNKHSFFNFEQFAFFTNENVVFQQSTETDSAGVSIFKPIKYNLFHYLFYNSSETKVVASNNCFSSDSLKPLFNELKNKEKYKVQLNSRTYNFDFVAADLQTKEQLVEANIKLEYNELGKSQKSEAKTDAEGKVTFNDIPVCSEIKVTASCEGYYDTTLTNKNASLLLTDFSKRTLLLRPITASITLIVKNLKTKSPLPLATITLKTASGKIIDTRKTNVNGSAGLAAGSVEFSNLPILTQITACASKQFFADSCISAKVKDLIKAKPEQRTIFLRPLENSIVFKIIDENTKQAIPAAKVNINFDGKTLTAVSAADGTVSFSGVFAGSEISIIAEKTDYKTNDYTVKKLKMSDLLNNSTSREIPLRKNPPPPPPPPPPTPPPAQDSEFEGESGDLRINLQWKTIDDLDIFVTDPCGNTIWALELTHTCKGGKGVLDIDANTNRYPPWTYKQNPQENIYWKTPAKGDYVVKVEYCSHQSTTSGKIPFNVTIIDNGKRTDYKGTVGLNQKVYVTTYTVK